MKPQNLGLDLPAYSRAVMLKHSNQILRETASETALISRIQVIVKKIFRHAQGDALEQALEHPEVDRKVIAVLLTTAISLTIQQYWFRNGSFEVVPTLLRWFKATDWADWIGRHTCEQQDHRLAQLLWWALGCQITYVIIPTLVVKCYLRDSVRGYGLKFRGIWGSSWIYLLMFLVMVGPLAFFSNTEAFRARYPFYNMQYGEPLWPRFCIWEVAYVLQFVALEFFFRGFIVHGLKHRLGFYSIFVMMVPYCMIHFNKPMPECCGAICAGIILGIMSLKTSSVWLGACLHVAVALSMDFLALWHKGMLNF